MEIPVRPFQGRFYEKQPGLPLVGKPPNLTDNMNMDETISDARLLRVRPHWQRPRSIIKPGILRHYLEKVLFPDLDRSRRRYETNALLAAVLVSLLLGSILTAVILYYNTRNH